MNTELSNQSTLYTPSTVDVEEAPTPYPLPQLGVDPAHSWWWIADWFESEPQLVTGGTEEVRTLVHSINGASWVWTRILSADRQSWFQVLGTSEACALEISNGSSASMLARTRESSVIHHFPAACAYWIPACLADEIFTADEAAVLGIAVLSGHQLPGNFCLRSVYLGDPASRN